MRSILFASLFAFFALGLVLPESNAPDFWQRFDVPGASQDLGFTIPENIPNGLYSVNIDSGGVAHHTRLQLPETIQSFDEEEMGEKKEEATSSNLIERRAWNVTCNGRALNTGYTDTAVSRLKSSCTPRVLIGGGNHQYAIVGDVAAYFCNFAAGAILCTAAQIVSELQERVSQTCGAYRAGWATYNGLFSIGQQGMNGTNYFCGRNH